MFAASSSSSSSSSMAAQQKVERAVPWVEKYRPAKVGDLAHQPEVVNALKESVATGNLPHLLFYGPPGNGKTSAILALARDMFGPDLWRERVLELNASDERGIDVIRDKVKKFAQISVRTVAPGSGRSVPPFKIIVLDEADSMTKDAQAALRRIIENYTQVTRFCIICNYVSRIIEPLQSRCAKFRFEPLSDASQQGRLEYIAKCEGAKLGDGAMKALLEVSHGDLRMAINILQMVSSCLSADEVGGVVTVQDVLEASGSVPEEVSARLLSGLRDLPTGGKDSWQKVVTLCDELVLREGYNCMQLVEQLERRIVAAKDGELTDLQKAKMLRWLGAEDYRLRSGCDERIGLLNLAVQLRDILLHPTAGGSGLRPEGNLRDKDRQRALQRKEKMSKGGTSQIEANQKALGVICTVCRQQFMVTQKRSQLEQHIQSKHDGKKSFEECFPGWHGKN
ncbi:replication factor C subunit 4 [Perkinsus chesapeaki]|uniref:Replication factor C subunit 4 n=1 Tax=Perkinsus chesapeaki TaxID=330153 RepID=A0A7J6LCQ4_PERCH|nr:replication factor C subunit 4 [Perkinsus chesapeaki]